jgi:hypothetical protein
MLALTGMWPVKGHNIKETTPSGSLALQGGELQMTKKLAAGGVEYTKKGVACQEKLTTTNEGA